MPQDVMHVLFEGVLAMETHMMLCTFLKKKFLSLSELNDRVKSFEFGSCEARNRPPKPFKEKDFDSTSSRLHLSGNQNLYYLLMYNVFCLYSCPNVDICNIDYRRQGSL